MAFAFEADESVQHGVRRIVRAQLKKASKELQEIESSSKSSEAVHSVRKRFKRLRAICRLVRDRLGEKAYRHLNYQFRDAGKPLTEARDSEVLVETFDKLMRESADKINCEDVAPIRRGLELNQTKVHQRVLGQKDTLCDIHKIVEDARSETDPLPIGCGGWSAIRKGLKRGYTSCQQACAAAAADASNENLHEWRKQAKYFWHELQLIESIDPAAMKPMANAVHELTKRLGDDHDLAVLKQTVNERSDRYGGEATIEKLLPLIPPRRVHLQKEAFEMQRKLFVEDADNFLDRLKDFWKSWRMAEKFVRSG
ncbi:MAG TPA: CHAD domain-containing protein [Pirellulales bacterium]|jgi:CHAD domain-containing protein|nr:CHAD domain-containing protein [Pirellulales bacterium]